MAGKRKKRDGTLPDVNPPDINLPTSNDSSTSDGSSDSSSNNRSAKRRSMPTSPEHDRTSQHIHHHKQHHTMRTLFHAIEEPLTKAGKVLAWSAPLILAGLEIRHELYTHGHKRRLMQVELEKTQTELEKAREMSRGEKMALVGTVEGARGQDAAVRDESSGSSGDGDRDGAVPAPSGGMPWQTTRVTRTVIRRRGRFADPAPSKEFEHGTTAEGTNKPRLLPSEGRARRPSTRQRVVLLSHSSSSLARRFDSLRWRNTVEELAG